MKTTPLNAKESFLLRWLSDEDSSLLGECNGPDLEKLVSLGLATISDRRPDMPDEYRSVSLTDEGHAVAGAEPPR